MTLVVEFAAASRYKIVYRFVYLLTKVPFLMHHYYRLSGASLMYIKSLKRSHRNYLQ